MTDAHEYVLSAAEEPFLWLQMTTPCQRFKRTHLYGRRRMSGLPELQRCAAVTRRKEQAQRLGDGAVAQRFNHGELRAPLAMEERREFCALARRAPGLCGPRCIRRGGKVHRRCSRWQWIARVPACVRATVAA